MIDVYIIVPVYNAERYILDTIESLLSSRDNGSFRTRVVFIDDGSHDNSARIIAHYLDCNADEKDRVILLKQGNCGVSAARNEGLRYVYGRCKPDDYIGFCDADDLWVSDWRSLLSASFENREKNEIIGYGQIEVNENKEIIRSIIPTLNTYYGGYKTSIEQNRIIHFGSYLYSTKLLKDNAIYFPDGVTNGEDLVFKYIAFFACSTLRYVNKPLYVYRSNPFQVTKNYSQEAVSHYSVLLHAWEYLVEWAEQYQNTDMEQDRVSLLQYSKEHIFSTCIYAARDYCLWDNGKYLEFCTFINEFIIPNIAKGVVPGDEKLGREYRDLNNRALMFYQRYKISGIFVKIKSIIKSKLF